jgi:hypothetical protein
VAKNSSVIARGGVGNARAARSKISRMQREGFLPSRFFFETKGVRAFPFSFGATLSRLRGRRKAAYLP